MAILCINTAFKNPSIALIFNDSSLVQSLGEGQHQTETLIPTIDALLKAHNLASSDLTKVIVVTGPGSFTALRIGAIAANTLAVNLRIPLLALDTFEYLKLSSKEPETIVLVHAGGNSVYNSDKTIIDFEQFLHGYNNELITADLSAEQIQEYGQKIRLNRDVWGLAEVCKVVNQNADKYLAKSLPLEPNYVKEANISKPKL